MNAPDSHPPADNARPRLILVTGLSGSGKSSAAKALEDAGYYCVDNLPLPLLRTFLRDPQQQIGGHELIAVVADVRATGFADAFPDILEEVDRERFRFTLLFLDASEEALVRRFSETRRSHPLAGLDRPLLRGIRQEREVLAEVRGNADLVLDTSDWSIHDLRREIYRELDEASEGTMMVSLFSFGFKHGMPTGSDLVFDVRFMPNPYFRPDLRELTGKDAPVQEFLEDQSDFREFLQRLEDFLLFLLPRYSRENRSYLSVAVGCTGGRHRSVASCEAIAERLGEKGWHAHLSHRDIDR